LTGSPDDRDPGGSDRRRVDSSRGWSRRPAKTSTGGGSPGCLPGAPCHRGPDRGVDCLRAASSFRGVDSPTFERDDPSSDGLDRTGDVGRERGGLGGGGPARSAWTTSAVKGFVWEGVPRNSQGTSSPNGYSECRGNFRRTSTVRFEKFGPMKPRAGENGQTGSARYVEANSAPRSLSAAPSARRGSRPSSWPHPGSNSDRRCS
jgi:hypothetical protein